ncbi:MAG TPA: leucyl aminopeptidase [Tepidiformaceae bacterium]|nr:leucyl aminopeptidase [Tepidiformaceae bacterium]
MEISVQQGDIATFAADLVIVNLFEGVTTPGGATGAVDAALDGAISTLIAQGDIRGKAGELTMIHTFGKMPAARVLVAGLGKAESFDVDAVRNLAGNIVRHVTRIGIRSVASIVHGAGIAGLPPAHCAQALAEGTLLGGYRFTKHKSSDDETARLDSFTIVERSAASLAPITAAVARANVFAAATNATRDLANEPANHLTPTHLAAFAVALAAETGIECEVLERADMERKGMGSLLSVTNGSHQPPKLVRLTYRGRGGDGVDLALVGKGITFDTGGISIKPAANMEAMKGDMTGAAVVINAIGAIALLGAKLNVIAIAPCTENMPGGGATKPGDVVTAMNGRTVEVINTDAEGRLVLADALCYAMELGATHIVDVATLTGAATTALGDVCYAVCTNNPEFAARFEAAAVSTGERTWRMPMYKEYDDYIKSDIADQKNTAGSKGAGVTAGAKFLEPFVGSTPWVHLDIASVDDMSAAKGWLVKGPSGMAVRPLIELALAMAEGRM